VTFRSLHVGGGRPGRAAPGPVGSWPDDSSVQLVPGQTILVEQPWTAGPSGEHTIIVRLEYDGSDAPLEAIQTVNVVKRPLHLHYWDSCPGLDYASAVMFSGSGQLMDEESFIDYWTNRGVLVLPWTGGICCTNSKTVDDMAQDWVGAYRTGFDGVTIDEFGS